MEYLFANDVQKICLYFLSNASFYHLNSIKYLKILNKLLQSSDKFKLKYLFKLRKSISNAISQILYKTTNEKDFFFVKNFLNDFHEFCRKYNSFFSEMKNKNELMEMEETNGNGTNDLKSFSDVFDFEMKKKLKQIEEEKANILKENEKLKERIVFLVKYIEKRSHEKEIHTLQSSMATLMEENEKMRKNFDLKEYEINELTIENKNMKERLEILEKERHFQKFNENNNSLSNNLPLSNSNNQTLNENNHEENFIEKILKNESEKKNFLIEKLNAKKFIEAINQDWNNFKLRRETINGALKNLGSNQYSHGEIHFLQEILQNVNDSDFSENCSPEIFFLVNTVNVDNSFLIVASNENGFKPQDIYSICNVAVSTKKPGEKIGQKGFIFIFQIILDLTIQKKIKKKGIGFKSIFVKKKNKKKKKKKKKTIIFFFFKRFY